MNELKVFKATWCGPCRALEPTLLALKEEGYNINFVDVDENPEETQSFGVRGVPTMVALKDGSEYGRLVGNQAKEKIIELLGA